MSVLVVGISHKTAKLDTRGVFHFPPEELEQALNDCCAKTQSAEVLILSTCNRVEIYCDSDSSEKVLDWIHAYHNIEDNYRDNFYTYTGSHTLKHAMRVASSLDSLVLGEPQILGQFKASHQSSMDYGCIGSNLSGLFKYVINAAKRIRTETKIGKCPVSVAYSALQMCDQTNLEEANVLVLGAGDTAKRLLTHISESGVKEITILNRTLENAKNLADKFNANAGMLTEIEQHIPKASVIIGALHTDHPIVSAEMLAKRSDPVLCIDISAPRSIDAAAAELKHVELISIDDIDNYISHNTQMRAKAADMAERIVDSVVTEYEMDQSARQAVPTIIALRENTDALIETEFALSLKDIQNGENPEAVLEEFAHKLKQKWLHSPSKALHSAAKDGNHELVKLAHTLFDI